MMNNEIKEKIPFNVRNVLEDINSNILWTYIIKLQEDIRTGQEINSELQQENAELKAMCKRPTPIDYLMVQKRYEDYKTRCEKAIEYINKNKHLSMFADCREPEEDWNYDLECSANDLLNILQNESEDNE